MEKSGMFSLTGHTAAVIGGGGVLAGAMAEGLADAGAEIAILDLNLEAAQARAQSIAAAGGRATGVRCNAAVKADLESALAATLARFGHVDILLNAAGVNSGTPFFEIAEEEEESFTDGNGAPHE